MPFDLIKRLYAFKDGETEGGDGATENKKEAEKTEEKPPEKKDSESASQSDDKYKELESKWQQANSELEKYKKEEKKRQEQEMSAQERLSERDKENDTLKVENLRLKVFMSEGLPSDLHEFVTGTDEATIKEQVKKLKEKMKVEEPVDLPGGASQKKPKGKDDAKTTVISRDQDISNALLKNVKIN